MLRDNERNVGLPWKAAVKLSRSSTWYPQLGLRRRRQEVGSNWCRRGWSVSKLASWLAARPPRCVHSTWLPCKVDGVEASPHQHDHHEETSATELPHSTVQTCNTVHDLYTGQPIECTSVLYNCNLHCVQKKTPTFFFNYKEELDKLIAILKQISSITEKCTSLEAYKIMSRSPRTQSICTVIKHGKMSGYFVHLSVSLHSYKAQLLDTSEIFTMHVCIDSIIIIETIKKTTEIISAVFIYCRPITNQLLISSHTWLHLCG